MTAKTDPYATKLHKRVDALLFVLIVLLIAFFLRTSARGESILSVAPQPFWSTLNLFKVQPKLSLVLVAPSFLAQGQPDYRGEHDADFAALAGLSGNSKGEFSPTMLIAETPRSHGTSVNFDTGSPHRLLTSSGPSLADNWSRTAGVGSTIPAYSTGLGTSTETASTEVTDSPQSDAIAVAVDHAPRYVGEPGTAPVTASVSTTTIQEVSPAISGAEFSSSADSASSVPLKLDGVQRFASKALAVDMGGPDAVTGTAKDFFQNAAMSTGTNYSPSGTPSSTSDVRITTSTTALTISTALAMESLNIDNGSTHTLTDSSATNFTLTLGNAASFTNAFSLVASDLIYLTGNSSLTISAVGSAGTLSIALARSGNFNIASGSTLTISSVISGSGFGLTKTGGGTVVLSGANTYTGVNTVSQGTLVIAANGALITGNYTDVLNGATLALSGGITVSGTQNVYLAGLGVSGQAALYNLSGNNSIARTINLDGTVAGSMSIGAATATTLTLSGTIVDFSTPVAQLQVTGSGTKVFSGANTYAGGTNLTGGTLALGSSSVVSGGVITTGPVGKGTLTIGTGVTLSSSSTTARTVSNNLSLSGSMALGDGTNTGVLTFDNTTLTTRSAVLTANTTLTTLSSVVMNDVLSGSGISLGKAGAAGTLFLQNQNTYSGGTIVTAGPLAIGASSVITGGVITSGPVGTGTLTLGGGTIAQFPNGCSAGRRTERASRTRSPSVLCPLSSVLPCSPYHGFTFSPAAEASSAWF